jgi:DNA-binding CsgD family transcriptional regulator
VANTKPASIAGNAVKTAKRKERQLKAQQYAKMRRSTTWISIRLGISERTVQRYIHGGYPYVD